MLISLQAIWTKLNFDETSNLIDSKRRTDPWKYLPIQIQPIALAPSNFL